MHFAQGHSEARPQRSQDEFGQLIKARWNHRGSPYLVAVFDVFLRLMGLDGLFVESGMNVNFRHRLGRLYDRFEG
jgi:hypothetical protein